MHVATIQEWPLSKGCHYPRVATMVQKEPVVEVTQWALLSMLHCNMEVSLKSLRKNKHMEPKTPSSEASHHERLAGRFKMVLRTRTVEVLAADLRVVCAGSPMSPGAGKVSFIAAFGSLTDVVKNLPCLDMYAADHHCWGLG